jgi:hypothetical protein
MNTGTIEVLGPFSGRPVKIRPQDIGRAVRDEQGRLFYVLSRPDGSGYYSAPSRAGGQRDIDRYDKYLARMAGAKQVAQERSATQIKVERRKAGIGRWVRVSVVLAVLGAVAYWAMTRGPLAGGGGP